MQYYYFKNPEVPFISNINLNILKNYSQKIGFLLGTGLLKNLPEDRFFIRM